MAEAIVEFRPEQGRLSNGMTDSDGHYALVYIGDAEGALLGTHSVRISTERYVIQSDEATIPVPEKVPAKYNRQSNLKMEVKAGRNEFDFDLTSQ